MSHEQGKICVYYDGACPKCIKDRDTYLRLAGKQGERVDWLDITGKENQLREIGIDPAKALTELHLTDTSGRILSELDAYILLMERVSLLRPFAWVIGLPGIRPILALIYHKLVNRRLRLSGR